MSYEFNGDVKVLRTIDAGRRSNQGATTKTITAQENLDLHSSWLQNLSAATIQDVVLPDATTLSVGWCVRIYATGAANLDVNTYDATTPISLIVIESGRMYEFTCTDNSDAAGTWHVNFLEQSDLVVSERYPETFDATSSWGSASGGYYTITILASNHKRGTNPVVGGIFKESGSDYIQIEVDSIKVLANGNIEIKVIENPDGRFAGKILVM
jgi:hypothetical protein